MTAPLFHIVVATKSDVAIAMAAWPWFCFAVDVARGEGLGVGNAGRLISVHPEEAEHWRCRVGDGGGGVSDCCDAGQVDKYGKWWGDCSWVCMYGYN